MIVSIVPHRKASIQLTLLFTIGLITLLSCSDNRHELLLGNWKIDSVYTYYNGFGHTSHDTGDSEEFYYQPDGQVKMTYMREFQYLRYEMPHSDTLVYHNNNNTLAGTFIILKLTKNQLVLKKDQAPIFKGENQERYEIRYFTKKM